MDTYMIIRTILITLLLLVTSACEIAEVQLADAGGGCGGCGGLAATASVSNASSTSSATGTGGSDGGPVTIGNPGCAGPTLPIVPIMDLVAPGSTPGDGTLAVLRVKAPAHPWFVTSWTYQLEQAFICQPIDHEALLFVGPAATTLTPLKDLSYVRVQQVAGSSVPFVCGHATVTILIDPPAIVHDGEVVWLLVKMRASMHARTCVTMCGGGGPDLDSFVSSRDYHGKVIQCPKDACSLTELSMSPTTIDAAQFGNDDRRFPFTVTGHK
jgi:hypothetical protein